MFLRAELHNHSTQSDGEMTVEELIKYADKEKFGVLALTDHNTVSGHSRGYEAILQGGYGVSLLPGVEVTTFYGHILALGLTRMTDLTLLNPRKAEQFFDVLRKEGARAIGIAHPFCIGKPVTVGCRFGMEVKDWSAVDYLEIANTSFEDSGKGDVSFKEALGGNEEALRLWEELVLSGYRMAAVTGKDIHQQPIDPRSFTTYAQVEEGLFSSRADAVIGAILAQKTLITKGPLMETSINGTSVTVVFDNSSNYLGWKEPCSERKFFLEVHDSSGSIQRVGTDLKETVKVSLASSAQSAVIKIYEASCDYGYLLAVGAPVYVKGEVEA